MLGPLATNLKYADYFIVQNKVDSNTQKKKKITGVVTLDPDKGIPECGYCCHFKDTGNWLVFLP